MTAVPVECGTLCCSIMCTCAAVYISYSPVTPPLEPDSASQSTLFGTVLYCKAARDTASFGRYGFRQLVRVQLNQQSSVIKPLSIQLRYLAFSQKNFAIKFMRYGLLREIRLQTLHIRTRGSQQDTASFGRYGVLREIRRPSGDTHSWAQRKLSPLSPLNIFLLINGVLISLGFNGLND